MTAFITYLVIVAGVLGLLIGSFLNVVAYRVPSNISLLRESRCPHCDAPIKPWQNVPIMSWIALGGRCANCASAISIRYPAIELLTGFAFAAVAWAALTTYGPVSGTDGWALGIVTVAFLYFAAISIVLAVIDLDTHRLPDTIVLPSYVVAGVLFPLAAWFSGDWAALARAGIGMAILYTVYFVLRIVRPDGMGGGDVKLAGLIGIHLGWIGWGALAVGAFAAFLYGGVFGIALMIARRAGRKTAIPFGPWMILGAWTGVFAGETIGRWYVDLLVGT